MTSLRRERDVSNLPRRLRISVHNRGTAILPTAEAAVKNPGGWLSVNARNTAPGTSQSQKPEPNRSKAAKAIAAGGHTRATCPEEKRMALPRMPETTYKILKAKIRGR